MSQDFEVRLYQRDDEKGIVDLLNLVYDGWPKKSMRVSSLEHWSWKYLTDPLGAKLTTVAISRKGEIVGCQHTLPINMKIGPEIVKSCLGPDLAVHPDYRKLGISNRLIDMLLVLRPKYGLVYNYFDTGNPILIRRNRKKYPIFPHPLKHLVKIKDMDLHLKNRPTEQAMLKKYGYYALKHSKNVIRALKGSRYQKTSETKIFDSKRFEDGIDNFWNEIKGDYDFIIEKKKNYLNWRYCDPRAGDYLVKMAVDDDGKIRGYIILRINRYYRDYPTGYIVDLLTLPNNPDVAVELVQEAITLFEENQVNIMNCLIVRRHPYEKVLDEKGFLSTGSNFNSFYIVYSGKEKEVEEYLNSRPNRVHYMYGNSDTI